MAHKRTVLPLLCALALSGCAQIVSDQEAGLAAAGFRPQPADTPERQAMLAQLPAHQFVRNRDRYAITYTYADPSVCHCLYVGTDLAYANYRHRQRALTEAKGVSSASQPSPGAVNPPPMR
jgi:hypothetical protein